MRDILEFFTLEDTVTILLLIWLLEFVGKQMSEDATVLWWARGFAAAGFLLYATAGIDAWHPSRAGAFLALSVRAVLAMGTVHGLARVTVPVVCFLYWHLWAEPLAMQRAWAEQKAREEQAEKAAREAAERQQAEEKRLAQEQQCREEERARQPPPPTREERVAAAKQRHQAGLQMLADAGLDEIEFKAAQEKAKQQYLRDLDEAMQ